MTSFKNDDNKLRYDLIPPEIDEALAEVLTYGCNKYAENSWQGIESKRYYAAAIRHLQAWRKGEKIDPESGLHHLKHCLTNIAFMLFKDNHNII